jgi:hypothetical protein
MPATVGDSDIVGALETLVTDRITPGTFVVLEGNPTRNYYIQFAIEGERLFCEAVSNQYLKPSDQLSDQQLRTLENLGWRGPEHEGQNWFRTFRPSSSSDYEAIVALARQAFVDVYGVARDAPLLMYTSWEGQQIAPATRIEFASEAHRSTYDRVASLSLQAFGDAVSLDPRKPAVVIRSGPAVIVLRVNPEGPTSSVVDFYSVMARQPASSPAFLAWLLRANFHLRFGALSIDGDGDVVLKDSMVGNSVATDVLLDAIGLFVDLAGKLHERVGTILSSEGPRDHIAGGGTEAPPSQEDPVSTSRALREREPRLGEIEKAQLILAQGQTPSKES